MGIELTSWEILTLVTRWVLYFGLAASIGGASSLYLLKEHRRLQGTLLKYSLLAALLAITSAFGHFFVRVGGVLEEGVYGMFEPEIVSFIWQSAVGDALLFRVLGLLILFGALVFIWRKRASGATWYEPSFSVALVGFSGILIAAIAHIQVGHSVSQSWMFQSLIILHLLLTAWWIGSLYPLWLASHRLSSYEVHTVLNLFGHLAVGAVFLLCVAGLYLSYQLTGWTNLFTNTYSVLLIVKSTLVTLMLGLAALHKFILVPRLLSLQDSGHLKKSLLLEKCIGLAIFAITSVLTTLVGPMM